MMPCERAAQECKQLQMQGSGYGTRHGSAVLALIEYRSKHWEPWSCLIAIGGLTSLTREVTRHALYSAERLETPILDRKSERIFSL